MIVTIDGPAGAGKSSAARELARRLGFRFLDTGAMYRAVALAAVEAGIDLSDPQALWHVAQSVSLRLDGQRILLDGRDVTTVIRTPAITAATRYAADHPDIRAQLVRLQREEVAGGNVVTEGRDQGTVVFPDAHCKIFLTASEEVRASRRYQDLTSRGEIVTLEEVLIQQSARDQQDYHRQVGALIKASDAIEVDTSGMNGPEVVETLEQIVRERMEDHQVP